MLSAEQRMARARCLFLVESGSYLYGTATPESDRDYVGVFVPTSDYFFGLKSVERVDLSTKVNGADIRNTKDDTDCVLYSATRFTKLLIGNNPNILEVFFAPDSCIKYEHPLWRAFKRVIWDKVLSKKADDSFIGFSMSQLHKLETKGHDKTGRTDLIEKYGYDTKCMYHAIRLLYEASEIAARGILTLPLCGEYKRHLLDIREGLIPFDNIKPIYTALLNDVRKLFHSSTSPLLSSPAVEVIDAQLAGLNDLGSRIPTHTLGECNSLIGGV